MPAESAPQFRPLTDLGGTIVQSSDAVDETRRLAAASEGHQDGSAPAVPGYLLTVPLGRGAFAQVWKAVHVRTGKQVAVKVFLQQSGVNWLVLQREVERLIKLDKHPHIVSLLDADLGGTPAYFVMDLLEQGSLDKFVKRAEAAPVDQAIRWMEEIADALAYVHAKGMLHCDLKPANVLVDESGHARVADFGQSRILSESGTTLGTMFYMAPEQAVLQGESGGLQPAPAWDIFALGRTMHAVLTGRVPHGEYSRGLEQATGLQERLNRYRTIIAKWPLKSCWELTRGRVSKDVAAIIAKCMEADPARRYASAGEVLADLKAWRERRPVTPLSHSRSYRLGKMVAKHRPLVLMGALALAIVGGAYVQIQTKSTAIRKYQEELKGKEAALSLYDQKLREAAKAAQEP